MSSVGHHPPCPCRQELADECPGVRSGRCGRSIADLIAASSLGTPEATALRATVSDERAREIVELSRRLEVDQPLAGIDWPTPAPVEQADVEDLSYARRLTLRQSALVTAGRNPFRGPVHDRAPADCSPDAPRNRAFTCATCVHRILIGGPHDGTFPKCELHSQSFSVASDCRGWWPACRDYASNDGRHAPAPD